ncbi:hypothetical protein QUG45_25770, partial [Enterobacter hormaechei]|nr:hypothetical protein [Enterobacter hormaechei]
LTRAGAPLLASEVVPFQQETLAQTARWASERRVKHFAGLALFACETSSQITNSTNGIEPPRGPVSVKSSKDGIVKMVVPDFAQL